MGWLGDVARSVGGGNTGMGGALLGSVGGPLGILAGYQMGTQSDAENRQRALIDQQQQLQAEEIRRRNKNIGKVRDIYGVLPGEGKKAGGKFQTFGTALQNNALIRGAVEAEAATSRLAGAAGLGDAAQRAGVAARAGAAGRGVMGSSIDTSNRQNVLATYLGNRASLAQGVEANRQAGWNAVAKEEQGAESLARGGGDVSNIMAGQNALAATRNARQAIPMQAFGNLLPQLGQIGAFGIEQNAMGNTGLSPLGLGGLGGDSKRLPGTLRTR